MVEVPEKTILLLSAASNHSCKPGMDCGENPHTDFCDEVIDVAITLTSYLLISLVYVRLEQNIPRNRRSIHS